MNKIIIAVDGFSSCGKSTLARALAAKLGYTFIDSGAMYRAVALYFIRNHVPYKSEVRDDQAILDALSKIHIEFRFNPQIGGQETYLNGENVEEEIRHMFVAGQASKVSTISLVRKQMVAQQQRMGKGKGIVMDGRDIGTVVFPEAELKLFMTADPKVRAMRRQKELELKGHPMSLDEVMTNLSERDHQDTTREDSPLKKAHDAIVIDNTHLTPESQFELAYQHARNAIRKVSGPEPANGGEH